MNVRYFEHAVTFVQKIRLTKPSYSISAYLEYGACDDRACLPPTQVEYKTSGKVPQASPLSSTKEKGQAAMPQEQTAQPAQAVLQEPAADTVQAARTDTAVRPSVQAASVQPPQQAHTSFLSLFFWGFIGGLLALVMPCIWPVIPMTVSFFLRRSKESKRQGVIDAILYGLSIIVIFVGLGLLITLATGNSAALNALSTNAVFNVFLFLLLLVFALSFFGWFEIKLPDTWGDRIDSKATRTTGLLSIFLMALTLVIVSFSCTAPIVGLLLVETVSTGNLIGPAVGMLGFALALAIPFTLFAVFPSLMRKSPKSGPWMTQIKIVLGFIELAFSLKFLSVADLAYGWHILDRETFLSLWIVIFGALGFYLVGWLKFPADRIGGNLHKPMPVPAIVLGLCSLAFSVYMIPGLWGAPCKAVSAFAPPMTTQDFNLNGRVVKAQYNDYDLGMAAAKAQHKPVLIDFTGYGCVNCRKMEAAVWTDPRVADKLTNDYVLISLFVDDRTPLEKPVEVNDHGRQRTLRTAGDKWSYLQSSRFGANAQPYYVPVDNGGRVLLTPYAYDESTDNYIRFLDEGLKRYQTER